MKEILPIGQTDLQKENQTSSGKLDKPCLRPVENDSNSEAFRKVFLLVERLFGDHIPPDLEERMNALTQKGVIVESDEELKKRALEMKRKPFTIKILSGFYDVENDKIYMRKNRSLNGRIHEMLHFLSARKDEKGIIDRIGFLSGKFTARAKRLLNEGSTELLAVLAEHEVDISQKRPSFGFFQKIRSLAGKNRALSYNHGLDTILDEFSGYASYLSKEKVEIRLLDMLPQLAKFYFMADPQSFFDDMDRRISVRIGKKTSQQFMERMEKRPAKEVNSITSKMTASIEDFLMCSRPKEARLLMRKLKNLLLGKNQGIDFEFEFPEYAEEAIKIIPSARMGLGKTPVVVRFNLGLKDLLGDQDFSREYLNRFQFQTYLLWQAIKIEKAKKGEIYEDRDFFNDPVMINYIASLGIHKIGGITRMTRDLLGIDVSMKQEEIISDLETKQRTPIIHRAMEEYRKNGGFKF